MAGILGGMDSPPIQFAELREHPLVRGDGVLRLFADAPSVPDTIIDDLAGNGPHYLQNRDEARELFRTAIQNFDVLHFQAVLNERYPIARRKALKRSRVGLKRLAKAAGRAANELPRPNGRLVHLITTLKGGWPGYAMRLEHRPRNSRAATFSA